MTTIPKTPITVDVSEVSYLIASMADKDPARRELARNLLVTKGRDAVVPLLQSLKSPIDHIRWEAAKTLAGIADPATANALVELLEDEDADVRWVASEALIALGRPGVEQVLFALLTNAKSIRLRDSAHPVLSAYAKRHHNESLSILLHDLRMMDGALSTPLHAYEAWKQMQPS